jgi:hypothetical protein
VDKNNIKEKIERIKILADLFLKDNIKIYIKDIYNSYYFANIISMNSDTINIKCFSPMDRAGQEFSLYWANILNLKKYEDKK